jgi:hypothetical protein
MRRILSGFTIAIAGAAVVAGLVAAPAAATVVTEVCRFTDQRFTEISGLALSQLHPGVIWLHNDSGGGPFIYAVDARTCRTLATMRIAGAEARDFEAIAAGRDSRGRPVLWIADVGDNRDNWPYVRLLRVREPAILTSATLTASTFRFTYSDRPHNAEALLADPHSQQLWVVTKQLAHGRIYALPEHLSRARINIARPLHQEGGLITDGAVSPDGTRYVLRDYADATIVEGLPVGRQRQLVWLPFQPQGEAVTWTADGRALLIASERDNRLLRVDLDPAPAPGTPAVLRPPFAASGTAIARVSG